VQNKKSTAGRAVKYEWMKNSLCIVIGALSLVLTFTIAILWPWSYDRTIEINLSPTVSAFEASGDFRIEWYHPDPQFSCIDHLRPYSRHPFFIGSFYDEWLDAGYSESLGYPIGTIARWGLSLHDWFLATVFALPLITMLTYSTMRKRSLISGACSICGYDLCATPDRCPECGTPARSCSQAATC
jgi:hypothetical protein